MQEHTVTQADGSKRVVGFLTRVDGGRRDGADGRVI